MNHDGTTDPLVGRRLWAVDKTAFTPCEQSYGSLAHRAGKIRSFESRIRRVRRVVVVNFTAVVLRAPDNVRYDLLSYDCNLLPILSEIR